jgi:hypothetical protein
MKHSEFVKMAEHPDFVWGIRGFYRPIWKVYGLSGAPFVFLLPLLLLALAMAIPAYGVLSGRPLLVIWALPAILAFLMGNPGLNMIILAPPVIVAGIGGILSLFLGPIHLLAGLLPFGILFVIGMIKGVTMLKLENDLRESSDLFDNLNGSGLLLFPGT